MKNRWAILTCCSETPKNWATEKTITYLQGFTMDRVNLALCGKLKKLWSEDSEMGDKMTSLQHAQIRKYVNLPRLCK